MFPHVFASKQSEAKKLAFGLMILKNKPVNRA